MWGLRIEAKGKELAPTEPLSTYAPIVLSTSSMILHPASLTLYFYTYTQVDSHQGEDWWHCFHTSKKEQHSGTQILPHRLITCNDFATLEYENKSIFNTQPDFLHFPGAVTLKNHQPNKQYFEFILM